MESTRVTAAVVLSLFLLPIPVLGEEVVLNPAKDNTLYEDAEGDTSNGAGEHLFFGRTKEATGGIRRALLAFDLSAIPPGSVVQSVTVRISVNRTPESTARQYGLHRVAQNWGEGSSNASGQEGRGAAAQPGDATWLHTAYPGSPWAQNGGDFVNTASATADIGGVGNYTFQSTPELVQNVQDWINNPQSNFGWMLRGQEGLSGTARRFASRENPTAVNRPQLQVVYAAASAGSLQFSSAAFSAVETDGTATISVTRTGGSAGSVTVQYATADGTAVAGSDYETASGTLSFADGEDGQKSFEVVLLDGEKYESEKTVLLSLSNPAGGASLGNPASAILTITDEEDLDEELHFAQFGNGTGFFSQILLLSKQEDTETSARVVIRKDSGQPFPVTLNGQLVSDGILDTDVPAGGLRALKTDAQGVVEPGSVSVLSDEPLAGVIVFGGAFGLAGVGATSQALQGVFSGPVEVDTVSNFPVDTGVAIQNLEDEEVLPTVELVGLAGEVLATAELAALPPLGHTALFVTGMNWDAPVDLSEFRGNIRVRANGRVAASMLQVRTVPGMDGILGTADDQTQFATLPVVIPHEAVLFPAKDNTLIEHPEGEASNGIGVSLFAGRTGEEEEWPWSRRRAVLAFDLSSIPVGSVIQSVSLSMTVEKTRDQVAREFGLHRLAQNWGEGLSDGGDMGFGTDAAPGDATWIHTFFDEQTWNSPGGDFIAAASSVASVEGVGPFSWPSTETLVEDVQSWLDDPSSNFGWAVVGGEESTFTTRRLASRENASVTARPRLSIVYSPPQSQESLYFAQFGNGDGFFSQIILLNKDDSEDVNATIRIRKTTGDPFPVSLNGEPLVDGTKQVVIPSNGMQVLQSDATGTPDAGSVTVESDRPLAGVVVFGGNFGLAGVGSSAAFESGFVGPVEEQSPPVVDTGIAVQNLEATPVTVSVELVDDGGTAVAAAQLPALAGFGQAALFLSAMDWDSQVDFSEFRGVVRVTADGKVTASLIQFRTLPGPDGSLGTSDDQTQFATLPVVSR